MIKTEFRNDSTGVVDVRVCGVGALSLCIRESCNYML